MVLGVEPKALGMKGKCSTTESYSKHLMFVSKFSGPSVYYVYGSYTLTWVMSTNKHFSVSLKEESGPGMQLVQ